MAAPRIISVTTVPDPPIIRECETVIVTVNASEPITGDIILKLTVTNEEGESTQRDVIVSLTGNGPLTYSITAPLGTITQDATRPNVFTYQAPCPPNANHNPVTHLNESHD